MTGRGGRSSPGWRRRRARSASWPRRSAPGTPAFCQAGQEFILSANVEISKGGGGDSYDIGFFAGETGNDPGAICALDSRIDGVMARMTFLRVRCLII